MWDVDFLSTLLLFIAILGLAGQVNRAIYRLAWNARPIGPWSAPHPDAPPRVWSDRIPVWGWLGLERESMLHGRGYWVRPMLIELTLAIGLVALFLWERQGGLLPGGTAPSSPTVVYARFAAHAILIMLMTVATFIDVDEKMIPDAITVTGTLIGLGLAALWPWSLLPVAAGTLWLCSPNEWSEGLDGWRGLAIGLAIFASWCAAIVPKLLWFRRGWLKGIRFMLVSVVRYPGNFWYLVLLLVGSLAISAVWARGADAWRGLLTSLVGLLVGGGVVWAVRIVASRALLKEAMGFGDVTLMAMIGTFMGWQPSLMIFFLAPFAGAIIAVVQYLIVKEAEIAYGPFLCVATLFVLLQWPFLWERWGPLFQLGWLIPVILGVCLILMGLMLVGWRLIRGD